MLYRLAAAIQTVLIIIVPHEVETDIWWLRWNEFTAAGWTAAILGLINLVLLMPVIFTVKTQLLHILNNV